MPTDYIYAMDPSGKVHRAPRGTAMPEGWKPAGPEAAGGDPRKSITPTEVPGSAETMFTGIGSRMKQNLNPMTQAAGISEGISEAKSRMGQPYKPGQGLKEIGKVGKEYMHEPEKIIGDILSMYVAHAVGGEPGEGKTKGPKEASAAEKEALSKITKEGIPGAPHEAIAKAATKDLEQTWDANKRTLEGHMQGEFVDAKQLRKDIAQPLKMADRIVKKVPGDVTASAAQEALMRISQRSSQGMLPWAEADQSARELGELLGRGKLKNSTLRDSVAKIRDGLTKSVQDGADRKGFGVQNKELQSQYKELSDYRRAYERVLRGVTEDQIKAKQTGGSLMQRAKDIVTRKAGSEFKSSAFQKASRQQYENLEKGKTALSRRMGQKMIFPQKPPAPGAPPPSAPAAPKPPTGMTPGGGGGEPSTEMLLRQGQPAVSATPPTQFSPMPDKLGTPEQVQRIRQAMEGREAAKKAMESEGGPTPR